ncbi:MAG: hypothetical protein NTV77_00565 [Candidatus Azambacteria bacterium]|nr:hypothetical protein [Candidatus Azambacteria bacterium]
MKFNIKILKWANFYFFVQNLSEWHFSCNHEYNQLWKKELGSFSKQKKNALKNFAAIHKKSSFGEKYLGQFFFTKKNPLAFLKNILPQKRYRVVNKVLMLFAEDFNYIYQKDFPLLMKWKKILEQHLKNEKLTKQIDKDLATLYRAKPLHKDINIYLLFSAPNYTGGGSNIDKKSISLEISRCSTKKVDEVLGIIWHELIHLHFEKTYFRNLLKKKILGKKVQKISEATASSLFPLGVLGKKYFGLQTKRTLHSLMLSPIHTASLIKISMDYLEAQKSFDEKFIRQVLRIIK